LSHHVLHHFGHHLGHHLGNGFRGKRHNEPAHYGAQNGCQYIPPNGMRISRWAGLAPLIRDKPCWQTESNNIKSLDQQVDCNRWLCGSPWR